MKMLALVAVQTQEMPKETKQNPSIWKSVISKSHKFQKFPAQCEMTETVLRKEKKQSLAQHKNFLTAAIRLRIIKKGLWRIGWKIKRYFEKFPGTLIHLWNSFSWGDINRVCSQKSDLDAKEFCELALFYYLTWWWTEQKSTMTKCNASQHITPGKGQGTNCQTDSPNASSLVMLNLLPGPETDLSPPAHPAASWGCSKRSELLLFLHLLSRGS